MQKSDLNARSVTIFSEKNILTFLSHASTKKWQMNSWYIIYFLKYSFGFLNTHLENVKNIERKKKITIELTTQIDSC